MDNKLEVGNEISLKYGGRWLELLESKFLDRDRKVKNWEYVRRKNGVGAVLIVAKVLNEDKIIIIRQYRVPLGGYIFEFPAGLMDCGDTIESCANRELMEETGYEGKIIDITPSVYSSPGLTDESVNIVFMEIDHSLDRNREPMQALEASEDIEVFMISRKKLYNFLMGRLEMGDKIESKLMLYAVENR